MCWPPGVPPQRRRPERWRSRSSKSARNSPPSSGPFASWPKPRTARRCSAPGIFPRESLMAALFAQLGAPAAGRCCQAAQTLPAPRLEVPAAAPRSPVTAPMESALQAFYPYCATCHQTAETFPPNFLTGSSAQVATRSAPVRAAPLCAAGHGRPDAGTPRQDPDATGNDAACLRHQHRRLARQPGAQGTARPGRQLAAGRNRPARRT